MSRITQLILLILFTATSFSFGQDLDAHKNRLIARSIFHLAQEGHQNFDAVPLLDAVDLLLKYPHLVSIEADTISQIDSIPRSPEFNYFDFYELYQFAKKYAPFDDQNLQKRLQDTDDKLPPLEMGVQAEDARIENGNYLVLPNKSRAITKSFDKTGMVNLTIEYGGEIKLMVKDLQADKLIGQEQSNQVVKFLDFEIKAAGDYQIIIENKSTEEKDCFLTIESR